MAASRLRCGAQLRHLDSWFYRRRWAAEPSPRWNFRGKQKRGPGHREQPGLDFPGSRDSATYRSTAPRPSCPKRQLLYAGSTRLLKKQRLIRRAKPAQVWHHPVQATWWHMQQQRVRIFQVAKIRQNTQEVPLISVVGPQEGWEG